MPPHAREVSLARRVALPLGLSLLLHAAVLAPLLLVSPPDAGAPAAGAADAGRFSVSLVFRDAPPPRPQPISQPKRQPGEAGHIPIGFHPVVQLPAAVPGGAVGPGAPGRLDGAPSRPSPRLFRAPGPARRVVYLLDRSLSMGLSHSLDLARNDLIAALWSLAPETLFQVIPYHRRADPLRLTGSLTLVPADPAAVEEAVRLLRALEATGSTDHVNALRRGLLLRPDVLFLATDADDLADADVDRVTALNGSRTAVHVIDLSAGRDRPDGPLARLATRNGGRWRRPAPP